MLIEPLHAGPGPPVVLGWCGTFAPNAERIDTPWRQGPDGFEADVACPVGAKIIHVPEPLATVELQVAQQDAAGLYTTAAVLLAMDVETVQMLITPGEQDLQDGMEMRQRGLASHKDTTPDEWGDAAQDDAQLVETERCSRGHHVLRVTQCRVSLKDSPRYLALSMTA